MSVRPGPLSEARKKAMVDEIQVGNRLKDRSDWSRQDKVVLSAHNIDNAQTTNVNTLDYTGKEWKAKELPLVDGKRPGRLFLHWGYPLNDGRQF